MPRSGPDLAAAGGKRHPARHRAGAAPGKLTIRARRRDGHLEIEIGDSGPGLLPSNGARSQGIGIANTRARLQALYGERHGFELRQRDGLLVSLRIPVGHA